MLDKGNQSTFLLPTIPTAGNYSMFAAPRPILPGEPEDSKPVPKELQVGGGSFSKVNW